MHIGPPVAFVLKQVTEEEMTDVLPAIQELSVSSSLPAGPVREVIEQFVAARGLPAFEKLATLSGGLASMMPMTDESSLLPITSVLHFNSSTYHFSFPFTFVFFNSWNTSYGTLNSHFVRLCI